MFSTTLASLTLLGFVSFVCFSTYIFGANQLKCNFYHVITGYQKNKKLILPPEKILQDFEGHDH